MPDYSTLQAQPLAIENSSYQARNKKAFWLPLKYVSVLALTVFSNISYGDLTDLLDQFDSELERQSAITVQGNYDSLVELGCDQPSSSCTQQQLDLFSILRELVHNANELTGEGPTDFSLGSNIEALGFALRWTAGEEFSAQGELANSYVKSQITSLATRLKAIKLNAGKSLLSSVYSEEDLLAHNNDSFGGGASDSPQYKNNFSVFINSAYTTGDKDPTEFEDAFDYTTDRIDTGFDYRFNENWVAGAVFSYNDQEIEFDPTLSIVGGGMKSDGYSVFPFVIYQKGNFFSTFAYGFQEIEIDTERDITYPSFNPDIPDVNASASSTTNASSNTFYSTFSYAFSHRSQTLEPYIEYSYANIDIEGFEEEAFNQNSGRRGYAFSVSEQDFTSSDLGVGVRYHYTMASSLGVFTPFIDVQAKTILESEEGNIEANFSFNEDGSALVIPTEQEDDSYQVHRLGITWVIRGSQFFSASSGYFGGGLSAFFNFENIVGLETISEQTYTAGMRYEF